MISEKNDIRALADGIRGGVRWGSGAEGQIHCPYHEDKTESCCINIEKQVFICHACSKTGTLRQLFEHVGVVVPSSSESSSSSDPRELYDYRDADGKLIYQVVRYIKEGKKSFFCHQPDGAGGWKLGKKGLPPLLYKLPEVLKAISEDKPIFVVEGEKDVAALAYFGFTATTCDGGSVKGRWKDTLSVSLDGAKVFLCGDADVPGVAHMQRVKRSLQGIAREVFVIDLGYEVKKSHGLDVGDWFGAGHTKEEFQTKIDEAVPAAVAVDAVPVAGKLPARLGVKIRKEVAEEIKRIAPASPDPALKEAVLFLLNDSENDETKEDQRRNAGVLLMKRLKECGGFLQGFEDDALYFFFEKSCQLFRLDSNLWLAFLYALTGCNPAGADFTYLKSDCESQALFSEKRHIYRVAFWDAEKSFLYISRYDGSVFRLDGSTWIEEPNGKNVLFFDDASYVPFTPDITSKKDILKMLTHDLPAWDELTPGYSFAFLAWIGALFFSELMPTRPILTLIGEKGSGKSMLLRLVLRLLFGPFVEIGGVPDKADGFTALASASHLLVMDNLDTVVTWLRDRLARLSTGGSDSYRKLYSSNELGTARYRCWLACTSRQPDTLRRDDLTDRLLILRVRRIAEEKQKAERYFISLAEKERNSFWGSLFMLLSEVITALKDGKLSDEAKLRMGDFESFARMVAYTQGSESVWDDFVENLKLSQSDVLLEGEPIVDAVEIFLLEPGNYNRKMTARELFAEFATLLFGDKKASGWYKSVRSFGNRMASIQSDLVKKYNMKTGMGTERSNNHRKIFWFEESKVE